MTTSNRQRNRTLYLVQFSMLVAVLLMLEFTGLGYIKTLGLEFTIMTVPVIVGAIVLGPLAGTILGAVFGLSSLLQAITGKSPFGAILYGINPLGTVITTVPTRILMGLFCGLLFVGLTRWLKNKTLQYSLASLAGALLNTLFFMTSFLLFFYRSQPVQEFAVSMGSKSAIGFAFAFVGLQGFLEAVICAVLGTAISRALATRGRRSA